MCLVDFTSCKIELYLYLTLLITSSIQYWGVSLKKVARLESISFMIVLKAINNPALLIPKTLKFNQNTIDQCIYVPDYSAWKIYDETQSLFNWWCFENRYQRDIISYWNNPPLIEWQESLGSVHLLSIWWHRIVTKRPFSNF